ncbi:MULTISPECIES: hemerythrin domain-containing protein [Pseudomonadaceae]|uniref:Hemerythrin HHE cation binding domain protein n=2 Tax=Ectopseudomonas TaxID=3236654 RepID=A4XUP6_ECTM1|nr:MULTISPECIES: hemerythrin domain-containing protein [Pseudomonas]ARS48947.1 hemerythrin [Pseudomonas mendocina]MBA4244281.1 hemerythrin [Pseudomonas sp.]MBF8163700.1 hemerythrin domain-containing protein [Pseudomonas mendocina]MDH0098290.1 hemerythrin domain-containing protein [Pseudomonas sp. GD04158]USR41964.1 hemerythrin domain-containing protein [Pseudomonas hydrolytica]
MNAIELLKKDHETVKELLSRLEETTERAVQTRKKLISKIEQELKIHTALEEQIFYPAFRQAGSKDDAVLAIEAKEEHRAVEALVLPDIKQTSPSTLEFAGRVKVLKELLEHHIEEEENDMFPQARKLLGKRELEDLGQAMETLRKSLKQGEAKAA